MSDRYSERLRTAFAADWSAAIGHRFVDELFAGTVAPERMRAYLVQDYQFIDRFVALLGSAIASADLFTSRVRLAQFTAMITGEENTYFQRAFDALGVPAGEREAPALAPVTRDFQALMGEAADSRDYAACLAVLSVAEGLYLDWADRPGTTLPADFIHAEWITLHNNDVFRAFVAWLRSELDRVGATLAPERERQVRALFGRAVALERAFFDHVYAP
ncbi:TenA family protein [Ancylobacter terrae]|uniref:TenA family protein n=1 Tax=Ancylobacter sp. sgz301288 TaxID=3342077 RepID=UPI00385E98ED